MQWLTREMIQDAAKGSRKEAILCSLEHWRQLMTASQEELKEVSNLPILNTDYCALCTRYSFDEIYRQACKNCRLRCLTSGLYHEAWDAFRIWDTIQASKYRFRKWRVAARAVHAKIQALYEKEYGKQD